MSAPPELTAEEVARQIIFATRGSLARLNEAAELIRRHGQQQYDLGLSDGITGRGRVKWDGQA